jgi:glycosyltransferase involved in cell wall biosynthesis
MVTLLSELPKYNWDVEVVCMASTKFPTGSANGKNEFERSGEHKGVKFCYTSLFVKASKFLIFRMISGLWGLLILPYTILSIKIKHRHRKVTLLTNLTQGHYVIYLKLLSLFLSAKYVLLRSEYPGLIRKKTTLTKLYEFLMEKWIFRLFDGFALMTNSLMDYFKPLSKTHAKFELVPMTVDIHRFSGNFDSPFDFNYIAYAGSLSNEKDGVDILLRSFLGIAANYPAMHLVIIGDTAKSNFYSRLTSIIQDEGAVFKNRIHFTGRIDARLIPQYLTNANILALARPDSKQAQGGFPTKLGEYLATGKPVIVTSVGEIPNYLSHRKNAILCEPGSVSDFTRQLKWILQHEELHLQIGSSGKKLAHEIFNSVVQGKRFESFLQQINTD